MPFTRLDKPLSECNVAVVTTSHLEHHESFFGAPATDKEVYHHPTADRQDWMFTDDLSWDRQATHTDDPESFLPLGALTALAADSRIGGINHRFFGVPTRFSKGQTGHDATTVAEWCVEDEVDIALLVPL